MHCTLNINNINWIPPVIDSKVALAEWVSKAFGFIQHAPTEDYQRRTEQVLNAIIMAAAGENNDARSPEYVTQQWTAQQPGAPLDLTYGCVIPGTQVMAGIWVVLSMYLLIFLPLLLGFLVSFFLTLRSGLKELPTNLADWQAAWVRALVRVEEVKTKSLRKYSAVAEDGKLTVGLAGDLEVR
jgi:hypothetical protein